MNRLRCNVLPCGGLRSDPTLAAGEIELPSLDHPGYYILSNDEVRSPLRVQGPEGGWVFLGIGSPHVFHLLAEFARVRRVERVFFIDSNPRQLGHLLELARSVLASDDRAEYLQRLFCGRIAPRGREALGGIPAAPEGTIRGARSSGADDGCWDPEQRFWSGFEPDLDRFRLRYGRDAELSPGGVLTSQEVIGGIDRCVLTVACGTRERYPAWPFTAGYGSGFLRDEDSFRRLKRTLDSVPVTFLVEDLTAFAEEFLRYYRYFPVALWTSNLLTDWFADRFPGIRELRNTLARLGRQVMPDSPESDLYLFQDEREEWQLPAALRPGVDRRRPKLSIHTRTFREVSRRLEGQRCLEVVNVSRWVEEDGGTSKLPCTEYVLFRDLLQVLSGEGVDTVFFHILAGHGVSPAELGRILLLAREKSRRLLVLEHDRRSPDFWGRRGLVAPGEVRDILGREDEIVHIQGDRPWRRNFLMVYDRNV